MTADEQTALERRLLIELLAERVGATPEWVRSEGLPALLRASKDTTLPIEVAVEYVRELRRSSSPAPQRQGCPPETPKAEEPLRRDTRWDKDRDAFRRLQPELQRDYPGKFIAFDNGEVIAVGDTRLEAAERAWERLGSGRSLFVRNVDEDIQPPRRIGVRLDRPRSVVRGR